MERTNHKRSILIIEDSLDIQTLLSRLLRSEGYFVDCADNGRDAIDKLAAAQEFPDLILLDLMMPEMDGYEFRRAQENDARTSGIPIVVMSAGGDLESKSMKIGAKAFLKKPFLDVDSILDTVGRFFPDVPTLPDRKAHLI